MYIYIYIYMHVHTYICVLQTIHTIPPARIHGHTQQRTQQRMSYKKTQTKDAYTYKHTHINTQCTCIHNTIAYQHITTPHRKK